MSWEGYSGWNKDTFKNAGTYTVTVTPHTTGEGRTSPNLTGSAVSKSFTVAPASLGSNVTIKETSTALTSYPTSGSGLDTYYKVYLGKNEISGEGGDVTLTASQTDAQTKNGQLVVTATQKSGNGNVTGSFGQLFYIKTDLSGATVTQSGSLTYNGKAQKPSFTVKLNNTTLTEGEDYEVTGYSGNINASDSASATITGINRYSGTKNGTYKIAQKALSSNNITAENILVGSSPNIKVVSGGSVLTKGTDYTYSDTAINTAGQATVNVQGINNYSGSFNVTFRVVDRDYEITSSDVTWTNTSVMYTGSSQSIGVSLKKGGSNYKITYTKDGEVVTPKEVGTYTATLTGTGNYAGTVQATFTINPITLDQVYVSFGSTIYNKDVKKYVPSVTLKAYSSNTVVPTTDYSVEYNLFGYSSYVTPYVRITPVAKDTYGKTQTGDTQTTKSTGALEKGTVSPYASNGYKDFNYTGSIDQTTTSSVSVTVTRAYYKDGSSEKKITLTNGDTINYVGERVYLDLTVYDSTNKRYLSSYEYTVGYKNSAGKTVSYMQDADTYTMTIENSSSYGYGTFKTTKTFTIKGNDISAYTVTLDKTSIDATGSAITLPKVTKVSSGSSTLSSSEYTYTYQDADGKTVTSITAPGTYKVVVKGAGKYSGTTSATFKVVGKSQSITGVASSYRKYKTSKAFQLTPSATEGTFTYSSSDTSVATVSSTGLVTPLKAGRAKITITTTGNKKYDPAEYSTVIKVYPNKAVQTQKPWTTGNGKIKVRWDKQEGVTRYEVRYSRNKSFASGTYLTKSVDAAVNDYTTQSTTIKNLVRGTTYYVKVRAVTEVYNDNGKKLTYYGNWSGWRSIKTK